MNVMNKFNGIVVETSFCLVQGIKDWVSKNDHFSSIQAAFDWEEVKKLSKENGDIILVTTGKWINQYPGIQLFKEYFSRNQVKTLCLIDKNTTHNIVDLYHAGIQCFIAMDDSQEEFTGGLKELVNGKRFISSELLSTFLELRVTLKTNQSQNITLTKREEEVLDLISKGFTNKEISAKLFLSKRTIDGYRESILYKFGARNTAQLITIRAEKKSSL
jgi:DNA-binding NarL/FixJ family response regulator